MELYKTVTASMDGKEKLLENDECPKISMLTEDYAEDIYILILHHYYINHQSETAKQNLLDGKVYPYGVKPLTKEGKGAKAVVAHLPEDLQKIIYRYLKIITV